MLKGLLPARPVGSGQPVLELGDGDLMGHYRLADAHLDQDSGIAGR